MIRRRRPQSIGALCLCLLGCGSGGPAIHVTLDAASLVSLDSLQVTGDLDGQSATGAAARITSHFQEFIVHLPAGSRGTLRLTVSGIRAGGCRESDGQAIVLITANTDYFAAVTLKRNPGCGLTLQKVGMGTGTVNATYGAQGKIQCGFRIQSTPDLGDSLCAPPAGWTTKCSQPLGDRNFGDTITLRAQPDADSRFAGWRGACSGRADCVLQIENSPTTVQAVFLPKSLCREDHLCWELPLPQGNPLLGLSGTSRADAWAVGALGTILRWNGAFWSPANVRVNVGASFTSVFAVSPTEAWVAGDRGLLHVRGEQWSCAYPSSRVAGLWASGPSDVWAVGDKLAHYDGQGWTNFPPATDFSWAAVDGRAADDVWAVGGIGAIVHWDGERWSGVAGGGGAPLSAVWVSASEVWVADTKGGVRHRPLPYSPRDVWTTGYTGVVGLKSIWGTAPHDVWAVGDGGAAHFDGQGWTETPTGAGLEGGTQLTRVWGSRTDDVWAVGAGGAILYYDGRAWQGASQLAGGRAISRLWGAGAPDDVWAVARSTGAAPSPLYRFNGLEWIPLLVPPVSGVSGVASNDRFFLWGTSSYDLWLLGEKLLARWNGDDLVNPSSVPLPDRYRIRGAWGPRWQSDAGDQAWVVGAGPILHLKDGVWSTELGDNKAELRAIWGARGDDVWAVGEGGKAVHFDGAAWTDDSPSQMSAATLTGVWGNGPKDIWAVGYFPSAAPDLVLHWDGNGWSWNKDAPTERSENASVWTSSTSDVWIATGKTVAHFDGSAWRTSRLATEITSVWGSDPNHVWLGTADGSILQYVAPPVPDSQLASCFNGVKDSGETDVDCGGACDPCTTTSQCTKDADCQSKLCREGLCTGRDPSCADGERDLQESDVDCGGPLCLGCGEGQRCSQGADCQSGKCTRGQCEAPLVMCNDGVRDNAETDVDCGGAGCPPCADGKSCAIGADCEGGSCLNGGCVTPVSCHDGKQDGDETGVDCGGGTCVPCNGQAPCMGGADCASGICGADHKCADPTCNDGVRNGAETDVDCGGGTCAKCGVGGACGQPGDCTTDHCDQGRCEIDCPLPTANCDGQEKSGCNIDIAVDAMNCGMCGFSCVVPHATPQCAMYGCAVKSCDGGFADCDQNSTDGCETRVSSDFRNCGGCGAACSANHVTQLCAGSRCAGPCESGWGDCNNDKLSDGCETDVSTDLANCGACGALCNLQNAVGACAASVCRISACNGTFKDCDKTPGNGCEVDSASDAMNCGACGKVCAVPNSVPACALSKCTIGTCKPGWGDCDARAGNGCEQDLTADTNNCGACAAKCSTNHIAAVACALSKCSGACAPSWTDCNGDKLADGCEADLTRDSRNCGQCGHQCMGQEVCVARVCGPRPLFWPAVHYPVGGGGAGAMAVAVGDANHSGRADLFVATDTVKRTGVLLNNGDGTFGAISFVPTVEDCEAIAAGDLNGDGLADLVVPHISRTVGGFEVRLSLGGGAFGARSSVSMAPQGTSYAMALVDVDLDGKRDAVVADGYWSDVQVFKGDGLGGFGAPAALPVAAASPNTPGLAVADFNADGAPDIAVIAYLPSNRIQIIFNKSNGVAGQFTAAADVTGALTSPASLATGDFDGNNGPDLVLATRATPSTVLVLLNNGNGTFQAPVITTNAINGAFPHGIGVADFDGDGKGDVAMSDVNGGSVTVFLGNGDGTLQAPRVFAGLGVPRGLTIGDFNADGKPDVATANYGDNDIAVLLNFGP